MRPVDHVGHHPLSLNDAQGLPAEKEALRLQFLDLCPNPTLEQYHMSSPASPASPSRLLLLLNLPCHYPEDPEVVSEQEGSAQVTG